MNIIVKDPNRKLMAGPCVRWLALVLLCAMAEQSRAVVLGWDPSPGVTGYKLYSGTVSKVYTVTNDIGNVTSNSVAGLTAGLTYFFALTAYNASGLESEHTLSRAVRACTSNRTA